MDLEGRKERPLCEGKGRTKNTELSLSVAVRCLQPNILSLCLFERCWRDSFTNDLRLRSSSILFFPLSLNEFGSLD